MTVEQPGTYRTTYAMTNWGATENPLTQGASLLFMLVCEDPFTFEGFASSPTVELFSERDMDAGAGAYAVFSAATAGLALDTTLDDGGQLRALAHSIGGSGAILVADENGTEEHTYGPAGFARVHREVPPGPLRVATAHGSALGVLVGVAFAPLEDVPAEPIVQPG